MVPGCTSTWPVCGTPSHLGDHPYDEADRLGLLGRASGLLINHHRVCMEIIGEEMLCGSKALLLWN